MAVTDHHNQVAHLFTGSSGLTDEQARSIQVEINDEVSILMSMMTPGWTERHFRFGSAKRAKRGIVRDQIKRARR